MKFKHILVAVGIAAVMSSCSSQKTVLPYFTDITTIKEGSFPLDDVQVKIRPDDELYIAVTSSNPEATAIYNLPSANYASRDNLVINTSPSYQTYVVTSKGDINFPTLGTLHVEGMTTEQLQAELTRLISAEVEDPMVRVELVNFNVNVAGEVHKPGIIPVKRNKFSILDALSAAGDLTEYGERSNVLVMREEDGKRVYAHLDLNSSDVFTSPYFYLQQNDYIYVEPNSIRQANSKYNQNNAFKLSVTSAIVSAASVIASLVIALTVK